jgi:hypothetical protein
MGGVLGNCIVGILCFGAMEMHELFFNGFSELVWLGLELTGLWSLLCMLFFFLPCLLCSFSASSLLFLSSYGEVYSFNPTAITVHLWLGLTDIVV